MKRVRISVDLEEDLFRKFSIKCIEKGVKKAEVIRRLIIEWIGMERPAPKPSIPVRSHSMRIVGATVSETMKASERKPIIERARRTLENWRRQGMKVSKQDFIKWLTDVVGLTEYEAKEITDLIW